MSYWTYVNGTIAVGPIGRTQHEMRYILETVLDHLPEVTGSEGNMNIHVVQKDGFDSSCSHDEFGILGRYSTVRNKRRSINYDLIEKQSEYILVLEGALRDRQFEETMKELTKFLVRLSKRLCVNDILVSVSDYNRKYVFSDSEPFDRMFESPSWSPCNKDKEPAWWEYLMWVEE